MGRPSKYREEFRREAVELYRSSDRPRCQITESLGIIEGSLAAWDKEADAADEPGAACWGAGRKKWRCGRQAGVAPGPDLIERDFTAEASGQRWIADITEFRCRDSKLHLAEVLDLHDRGLAGWSMATRATADIVVNALVMALARRQPDGEVIHHADRGGQYVSSGLALTMADHDVTASFGRTGVCWDNAAIESISATIKKEIRHIHGDWETMTRSQLRTVLFDYIETFYNRRRHQARLGHQTPAQAYTASKAA